MSQIFAGLRRLLGAALVALVLAGAVLAQPALNLKLLEDKLAADQATLDGIKKELTGGALPQERLSQIEEQLRTIRESMLELSGKVNDAWRFNKQALEEIGPLPGPDEEPEPESIARERQRLNEQQARLDNLVRGSEVFAAQAFNLIKIATAERRRQFFDRIFSRQRLPLTGFLWQQAGSAVWNALVKVGDHVSKWQAQRREEGTLWRALVLIGVALVLGAGIFGLLRRFLRLRLDRYFASRERTAGRPIAHAGLRVIMTVGLAALALEILLAALLQEGLVSRDMLALAQHLVVALLILVFAVTVRLNAVRYRLNLPGLPPAKVLARPWGHAAYLIISIAFAVDFVLAEGADLFDASLYFTFVQSFLAAMVMAAMLLVLALAGSRRMRAREWGGALISRQAQLVLITVAVVTIVAELLGYLAFGRYLVRTGIVLVALAASLSLLRATFRDILQRLERRLFAPRAPEQQPHMMFAFWSGLLVDAVLFVLAALIVLHQVRFTGREIRDWIAIGFQGFRVGSVTISLTDIIAAIVLFLILVAGTRFVQRFLEREILPQTRLDIGVRNSLVSFTGYAGLILAALLAVSALGVDLSNLAIIAGALSVGVGFGLQSIVNNFVSGLILLFERPIKVGDWIVTATDQGLVKKIGVRSTIIETFDRSALIIPNSELITSAVRNWTLTDRIGRVIIPVGVSYKSNPQQVHDILLDCAHANPDVLEDPPPYVWFKDYGQSSLDFELRAYLRNISDIFKVSNALRLAIWDSLKQAGIEIPFPQRDLHLKDIDRLEQMLAKARSARGGARGARS